MSHNYSFGGMSHRSSVDQEKSGFVKQPKAQTRNQLTHRENIQSEQDMLYEMQSVLSLQEQYAIANSLNPNHQPSST